MRVLYLIAACSAALYAAPAVKRLNARIPMRDGVRLSANVFMPGDRARMPAILERTPYGKALNITPLYQALVDGGYAVVAEDVRGRYESEGVFAPLEQEPNDGDDTLNWVASQPWCDGKIGMIGGSYGGIAQWKVALLGNPHLKAIFPVVSGGDDYRDRFYSEGGAMKLGPRLEWMSENLRVQGYHPDFSKFVLHLPLRTSDVAATGRPSRMFQEALNHPAFDSFWRAISVRERIRNIRVPVFAVGGWYDNFVESDLVAYSALHKSSGLSRIVVGPWPHNMSYRFQDADFGPDSKVPVRSLQLAWFGHWLMGKDEPLLSGPPLKLFVMGANKWREESEWPPAEARPLAFYLAGGGRANTLAGDGALVDRPPERGARDRFVFDPRNPAPTRGGAVCCNPRVIPWGPMDQRPVEGRKDVLVYTTRPLESDLETIGPVQVKLYAATSAKDTDFTAKLVDVFPDGEARNLTDGILRLRYRESLDKPELAKPGQVYEISIDAGVTANVFLKGHRIRLEISSSNFPRFDRNPNTGGRIADETKTLAATQTVYHDRRHPSELVLLVMPSETREPASPLTRIPRGAGVALRPR